MAETLPSLQKRLPPFLPSPFSHGAKSLFIRGHGRTDRLSTAAEGVVRVERRGGGAILQLKTLCEEDTVSVNCGDQLKETVEEITLADRNTSL